MDDFVRTHFGQCRCSGVSSSRRKKHFASDVHMTSPSDLLFPQNKKNPESESSAFDMSSGSSMSQVPALFGKPVDAGSKPLGTGSVLPVFGGKSSDVTTAESGLVQQDDSEKVPRRIANWGKSSRKPVTGQNLH